MPWLQKKLLVLPVLARVAEQPVLALLLLLLGLPPPSLPWVLLLHW
ncbi:hypothetical protein [Aeromonas caviae]|nr:hypothetical protein [Aeromonas caviae]